MKRKEQLMTKRRVYQRPGRFRGHIIEDRGLEKGKGDYGQGGIGDH